MVPNAVRPLFQACADAKGRALLVGGTVRDALLGNPGKDLDIEVHRLDLDALLGVLSRFGRVNEVGRSFGVLKLRVGGYDLDVSLPRRDSRAGVGHKGIRADADPFMGETEAARRRDLTINAIAYDPLADVFVDPFGGRDDLLRGVLRAVDPRTFGEDPLRALRVAQFAARFRFEVDPSLEALCADMPLHELPAERIRGEVEKLLTKGVEPSRGWALATRTHMWRKVVPEWDGPVPDGLDALVHAPVPEPPRRLALLYAGACGRLGEGGATAVLDRLRVHKVANYPVRVQVLFLVGSRRAGVSRDADVRRLAEAGDVELLAYLRGDVTLRARAEALGVARGPLPPLLTGKDLAAMGVAPGPEMGRLLARVRDAQLEGALAAPEEAREAVSRWMTEGAP
ncbi:MAG: CCA tRNA nucleotidyltransferase [Myxococcota bacterium]